MRTKREIISRYNELSKEYRAPNVGVHRLIEIHGEMKGLEYALEVEWTK